MGTFPVLVLVLVLVPVPLRSGIGRVLGVLIGRLFI